MTGSEIKNKSLKKSLDILNCFIDKQPLGVTEISELLGLNKSNVHDILSTFTAMDYLERDGETGRYQMGAGLLRLCRAISGRYSFQSVASEHIWAIANEVGEIVYLTVPLKYQICYLDVAYPIRSNSHMAGNARNMTDSMYSTGCGKAMLAHLPEAALEEYLLLPREAATPNTIVEEGALRAELQRIRQRGYATDNMENLVGISCVAVPLLSHTGKLLGAISISGPSPRFTPEQIARYVVLLQQHAGEIQESTLEG